ncbi:MAG: hypothetical protein WKG07_01280 [Hymenobacter sp.]
MINDMLSVSRINAQKFELTKAPVHLEEIFSDVVNELSALATARSLALKLERRRCRWASSPSTRSGSARC